MVCAVEFYTGGVMVVSLVVRALPLSDVGGIDPRVDRQATHIPSFRVELDLVFDQAVKASTFQAKHLLVAVFERGALYHARIYRDQI